VRRLLVLLGVAIGVLWLSTPAFADDASDAIAKFQSGDHVMAATGGAPVDGAKVSSAIGGSEIRIAIFPTGVGNPETLAQQIGQALGGGRTIGVIVGRQFNAASNVYCNAAVSTAAATAVTEHKGQLESTGDVTDMLVSWVQAVQGLPTQASCDGAAGSNAGSVPVASGSSGSGGGHAGLIIAILVGLVAVGSGALLFSRRRKRQRELDDLRAGVVSMYDRLGADVSNLDAKDDEDARQALADASERYTAAGSQLARADSPAKYEVARRTALEGLYAARTAREKLGLPLGADLPPLHPSTGDGLSEPTTVTVKGQDVRGYPDYQPGAPHYYGGGGGYAAGWYSMPFWETLLLTSALSGGFGGWGWGGGGGGFDSGYQEGYQDAQGNQGGDSGGGWGGGDSGGGSWGGDWGGGGGDWGGGGGGDWGGGGDGGGSW
jgi:hypothetical protein